eukprot:2828929-Heterocapsa_arctica.AAC.1
MDKDCPRAPPTGPGAGRGQSTTATPAPAAGGKGEGKGKSNKGGKKDGKFDGICNKCGRWGHRANE